MCPSTTSNLENQWAQENWVRDWQGKEAAVGHIHPSAKALLNYLDAAHLCCVKISTSIGWNLRTECRRHRDQISMTVSLTFSHLYFSNPLKGRITPSALMKHCCTWRVRGYHCHFCCYTQVQQLFCLALCKSVSVPLFDTQLSFPKDSMKNYLFNSLLQI